MKKLLAAAVPLALIGCTHSAGPARLPYPAAPASAPPGPSAAQLADGRWVTMAAPPIRLCQPAAVWDGHALIVIEGGVAPCHPAAAAYDPTANRWVMVAAPPAGVGLNPLAAQGAGRLIVMSRRTGFSAAWSPATRRWLRLPPFPAAGAISMTWTGRVFLVIASRQGQRAARAWGLAGDRWQPLPNLPPVWHGWYAAAPAATLDGSVYALAHEYHGSLKAHTVSGSSRLLRLTGSGWTAVPLPLAADLGTAVSLTTLDGRLLATGTTCPSFCMEEIGQAVIIGPGARPHMILLSPPGRLYLPFPQGIAAGPHAVVVTYSVGGNTLYGGAHFRAVEIYDPRAGRWLAGPRAPATPPDRAAYWTPYGVVSLGQGGGWVLRPGK
jgi:hypothetical protein